MCHMSRYCDYCEVADNCESSLSPHAQNTVHWVALSTGLWLKVCISMPRKRKWHNHRWPRSKYKFWRENGRWKKLWKTWCIFHGKCWGGDVPVLPLTPKHMHGIAAMFKNCGYTSYDMYVRVAKGMHIQSGAAWSKKLKLTFRETVTICSHNHTIRQTITRWNRYLARDPPSYDSGIPLSEADAKTMMDKIEARSKWLKVQAHEVPKQTIHRWKRFLARDPPSYDSGIPLSEAVAKTMMDKIEARSKWLDPGSRNTPLYGEAPPYMGSKVIRQLYEDVVDWQSQRCISSIPSRHSLDEEERRLGCRLQHALIRRYRDPTLANVDTSLINTIPGVRDQEKSRTYIRKLYKNVIEWQSQRRTSSIPRRHFFADDEERRLACRLHGARTLPDRAKLTKGDEALINSIGRQNAFKKVRESLQKAKESWKTTKERFRLTVESTRKAKATESLQKARRKRSEIRKAQSLWCARLLAVKKFQQQYFCLPVRNKRTTKREQRLANWLDKAKQRKDRALSSRPSERRLTPTEAVQLKELFDAQKMLDAEKESITRSHNARKKA